MSNQPDHNEEVLEMVTDTNQASELLELCKEVYKRTGWEDVRDFYHENDTFDEETQTFKRNGIFSIVERKRADYNTPLYTSDYLLEKLPKKYNNGILLLAITNSTQWGAEYYSFSPPERGAKTDVYISDTPLKALLKLTIALHDSGALK